MKKIFTTTLTLIFTALFAQDLEYAEKLNKIDSTDVFSFTEEIFSGRQLEYRIAGQVEKDGKRTVILYDNRLPKDVVMKDLNDYGINCNLCETIEFKYYYAGANKDLEIKGKKYYSLYTVYGTYLELLPWWRKYFAPEKSDEEILESYNLRSVQERTKGIDIRFSRLGDEWQIINIH